MKPPQPPPEEEEESETQHNEPITTININKLITTLTQDTIPKTLHFKTKWSQISNKLTKLTTQLNSLPQHTSLSISLLHSLSSTLSLSLSLSSSCRLPSLPHGKLRTQNDIDSVSARLDRHISDAEVLIGESVGERGVGEGGRRERVREEARGLVTRLQIGSYDSRDSAIDSLLGLLQEDDKNVLIAVAQGIVPVLVRLLDSSSSHDIKEKTVTAISRISTVDSSKQVLISEGLVLLNNLLRIVESGSGFAKEKACIALQALSQSKENARAIGSRGGISALLEICQSGTPSSQAVSAGVLRNLSAFSEINENFIEENAIFVLLSLSSSGTITAQENAIGCLCNLVKEDDQMKVLVAREGGIESLKSFWDSISNVKNLEVVVEFLRVLSTCPLIAEILVSDGFIDRVVSVLNCGALEVRISAAKAVYQLGFNAKTRKEFGELGCIPILIRLLDGKAMEEREASSKALFGLMGYAGNRRIFRKDERGIFNLVQILDPLVHNLDKKYPVSVLLSLAHSKKCRKQMISAGACLHLQKLIELEVEGAKKLLESLGRGKFWGVFARP